MAKLLYFTNLDFPEIFGHLLGWNTPYYPAICGGGRVRSLEFGQITWESHHICWIIMDQRNLTP